VFPPARLAPKAATPQLPPLPLAPPVPRVASTQMTPHFQASMTPSPPVQSAPPGRSTWTLLQIPHNTSPVRPAPSARRTSTTTPTPPSTTVLTTVSSAPQGPTRATLEGRDHARPAAPVKFLGLEHQLVPPVRQATNASKAGPRPLVLLENSALEAVGARIARKDINAPGGRTRWRVRLAVIGMRPLRRLMKSGPPAALAKRVNINRMRHNLLASRVRPVTSAPSHPQLQFHVAALHFIALFRVPLSTLHYQAITPPRLPPLTDRESINSLARLDLLAWEA
jgi:hypothetical protein